MTVRCLSVVLIFAAWMLGSAPEAGAREHAPPPFPAISAASEIDYPPFCIVDADGRASGFSVELMQAALAAMGRPVTFRTGPWSEVKDWLERGEIQALPLVGRTPERETVFDFTVPYMTLHGAIVVRQETSDIRSLGDLTGRRVAVMQNDNAEEFLRREARGIDIHTTTTFLKTLFMSGYTADVIAHREILDQGVCFIPKPFTKRDLAVKIRESLAQAR